MKVKRILLYMLHIILWSRAAFAQSLKISKSLDSITTEKTSDRGFRIRMSPLAAISSTAGIAYGFLKLGNHPLSDLDLAARHEFALEHPHNKFRVDDYLQFAPGALVLGLSGAGVKGRNSTVDQAGVYLLSNVILTATCQSIKRITKVQRPDGSSNAFPSGHTAEAFASAEFLSQEYGSRSIAYPISGYAAAVATAYYRMYNNKHWLSDVVAGAGIGFLSTRASYWLYPKIRRMFTAKASRQSFFLPSYSHGTLGAAMVSNF